MADWRQIVDGLPDDARRDLLAALVGEFRGEGVALLDQRLVLTPGDLAERPYAIEQWRGADGREYGVIIRALTFRDRMEAEREATITDKAGKTFIDPWRLQAEEVARGIVRPRVTVDQLLGWNDAVVRELYQAIHRLAPHAPALIAAELARAAGGDAPDPQSSTGHTDAGQPRKPRGRAARAAVGRPGGSEHPGAGNGDSGGAVGAGA